MYVYYVLCNSIEIEGERESEMIKRNERERGCHTKHDNKFT